MKPCRHCPEPEEDIKGQKCPICNWEIPTKEQRRINLEENLDYICDSVSLINH